MPNLLPQNLQNLLSNQSKNINLITEEFKNLEVSDVESNNYENIFSILSIFLIGILALLSYLNLQKDREAYLKENYLRDRILKIETTQGTSEEIQLKITNLQKIKNVKNNITQNSKFFDFLALLSQNTSNDNLITLNYQKKIQQYEYELIINSSNPNFETNFLRFYKEKFTNLKIEKVSEIKIPDSNISQFKFKGIYEL
jgi:hypothetical protein